ncbi:hypothetical protein Pint_20050 [Pistacia integerrima]|uniref:Uncharacterized protein n=1 Tax=Pistacia integerrima TaxID=434235 RepID=A0ACC0XBL9_9ROSI|nr:hypothetical protein Pint_20050 [Pistacia integerrima]
MAMKAAIELGLFEIMAKTSPSHYLSSSEIASNLPAKNHDAPLIVERILRLLASHSILTSKLWILHDWGDNQCLKLLKNCYNALPDARKVIVVESIMPEFPKTDAVTQNISGIDLSVFNTIPGAKDRTKEEFQALTTGAGFAAMEVICRA